MRRILWLLPLAAFLSGCKTTDSMPPSGQTEQGFQKRVSRQLTANYLLHLPPDYKTNAKKRWPLMIFLHGAGERGTNLSLVAKHGPPKVVKTKTDFPFILVSPQCPPGEGWDDETIMALRQHAIEKYRVDTNRVYLTGLSMGGFGSWSLAVAYPNKFAAMSQKIGRLFF